MPIKLQKLPAAVRWGLTVLCAAVCGVLWAYYWRVFFGLDNRVSPLVVTLGCAAFLEVCLLAGYCVRRFAKGFAAKGAVCIFLCGLLFAFAPAAANAGRSRPLPAHLCHLHRAL